MAIQNTMSSYSLENLLVYGISSHQNGYGRHMGKRNVSYFSCEFIFGPSMPHTKTLLVGAYHILLLTESGLIAQ